MYHLCIYIVNVLQPVIKILSTLCLWGDLVSIQQFMMIFFSGIVEPKSQISWDIQIISSTGDLWIDEYAPTKLSQHWRGSNTNTNHHKWGLTEWIPNMKPLGTQISGWCLEMKIWAFEFTNEYVRNEKTKWPVDLKFKPLALSSKLFWITWPLTSPGHQQPHYQQCFLTQWLLGDFDEILDN